ncbi:GNAT superfamily N-acetyltransferase [Labrenzia sp. EL_208]|nr:GNAT superfamily N-acetyltransferase [Labrenzia sp. EL_132]MBG6227115.1 GNAT superfamily N-acetyltransferase [Labrenzia sp. EL_208]
MLIRLALEDDFDEIVEMARENSESTRPEQGFSDYRVLETLYRYIDTALPTVYVAEGKNREIVGFVVANVGQYCWTDGHFAIQEVLYVKPEQRGGRVAVLLMKELIAWARRMGASEVLGGNDNKFNSERTARFLEHFGFERVGFHMRKDLTDGRREEREQQGS